MTHGQGAVIKLFRGTRAGRRGRLDEPIACLSVARSIIPSTFCTEIDCLRGEPGGDGNPEKKHRKNWGLTSSWTLGWSQTSCSHGDERAMMHPNMTVTHTLHDSVSAAAALVFHFVKQSVHLRPNLVMSPTPAAISIETFRRLHRSVPIPILDYLEQANRVDSYPLPVYR